MIKNEAKEMRKFAIVMFVGFLILAAISFWKDHQTYLKVFGGISLFFILFGLTIPKALKPVHWLWMKFAHVLGFIVTNILLTLTFYLVITPLGWISRLFGKKFLELKFDKNKTSYWCATEKDGPATRFDKPF